MLHRTIHRSALFLIVAGLALLAGPAHSRADDVPPAKKATELDDQSVAQAVEREIRQDRALPFDRIDVRVEAGVVSLRGAVGSLLARDRATRQAQTVRGVRSVVNRLVVVPVEGLTDDALAKDVSGALRIDPATDSYEITVTAKDGIVTLDGAVDSWRERVLSGQVARGVRGVRGVENHLTVSSSAPRLDSELQAEIEQALRWDVFVDHALIDVQVEGGVAKLSGVVGSAAEKRLARTRAWTRGIRSVESDDLHVERWTRDPDLRTDKFAPAGDARIRRAVKEALTQDPRVTPFAIEPQVDRGMVTLTGTVDNLRARRSAVADARNTVGVLGVLDHIRVRMPEPRSDEAMLSDIRESLRRNPFTTAYQIGVSVHDGVVHLDGEVDTLFERSAADDVASRVTGVRDIVNRLHAGSPMRIYDPYVDLWDLHDHGMVPKMPWLTVRSDLELESRIRTELLWSPFVDEEDVQVEVRDGVAVLEGTVGSWAERSFARENAYEAGATLVDNRLAVSHAMAAGQ